MLNYVGYPCESLSNRVNFSKVQQNVPVVVDDDVSFNNLDYIVGEDDDLLFEQNVIDDIELDMRTDMIYVIDDRNELDNSEYAQSDELQSVNSDSEEEVIRYL
ncbi:hypothetical protein Adt_06319 [Abeliophyllum distichum]|uniref:Uncharacterized protein n=1 Tax=Abeliophyllum distichum TaxID=126358 RepID=A0ABD1V8T1_9LAMI